MIVRIVKNKENPYFLLNRAAANDQRLSYKAVGIHTYLMSKPDNWEANEEDIINRHNDGRSSVRSGIAELRKYGYMSRVQERDPQTNRFLRARIDTYETPDLNPNFNGDLTDQQIHDEDSQDESPVFDFPTAGFPPTGNPRAGNQPLVINDVVSNESNDIVAPTAQRQQTATDLNQTTVITETTTETTEQPKDTKLFSLIDQQVEIVVAEQTTQQQSKCEKKEKNKSPRRRPAAASGATGTEAHGEEIITRDEYWEGLFYITHLHKDYKLCTKEMGINLGKTKKKLLEAGYTLADLRKWWGDIWRKEFPGVNKAGQVQKASTTQILAGVPRVRSADVPDFLFSKDEPKNTNVVSGMVDFSIDELYA